MFKESRGAPVTAPVLVLGAASGFGTSLVEAVLATGKPVVGIDADTAVLEVLAQRIAGRGRFMAIAGSTMDDDSAGKLAATLRELPVPPRQALVNLQGSCVRGRLLAQPADMLESTLRERLMPQLHAARHLLPLLASSGRCARYLVVGTPYAGTPWAGYGHYSVTAAAIRMLIQVLRNEAEDTPVRVQQLVIDSPVRSEENAHCACPEWPEVTAVARAAAAMLDRPDDLATFLQFDAYRGPVPRSTAEVIR
jgi:NAD(P)-dependent dehydrogenase (short-subunit alcohol dehydrogenase family)